MKTEHLLVIRFSAMGDVAMTVPVVYALATQYPHLRITVLSRPFARPFFEGLAPNVGFMGADIKGEYKGVKGLNALYRRLVAKQFTAVADLHSVLRSDYLRMRFHLDRYRVAHIDKHRKAKRQLVAKEHKQLRQLPTSFDNYAQVFARLGYPVRLANIPDGKDGQAETPVFRSIFGEGRGDAALLPAGVQTLLADASAAVGIAPFAAHQGKIYPQELMERVVALFVQKHPESRLFLFGNGADEMKVMDRWAEAYPQVTNASALLHGLSEELILMSHLRLMVSMDSGNMHFASLVGTPVVSIWGATHPYAGFLGWRQPERNAIQVSLPCRPCSVYGNKPCLRGDYACLRNIEPEMVVHRMEILLKLKSLSPDPSHIGR